MYPNHFGVVPFNRHDHRHAGGFRNQIQSPYFATGNPTTEEMTTLYAPGMLGCYCDFDMGLMAGPPNICRFQLVLQYTAIQGVVGQVFYWKNKGLYTITTDRTSGDLAGIGEIAAAGAASYIWIVKHGNQPVLFVAAPAVAVAAGLPVVASDATDGKADCLANANAQPAFPLIGTALGATAADLASVRINIPDAS